MNNREALALLIERKEGKANICRMCLGSGAVIADPLGWNARRLVCPECGGPGKRPDLN
jgi:DnaJ-class molecular chaperone